MSHFYATIQGSRGKATRQGTKDSGIVSYTASWQGAVRVGLREADGVDQARVTLEQWRNGAGAFPSITLYDGPISGEGYGVEEEQYIAQLNSVIRSQAETIERYERELADRAERRGFDVTEVEGQW